MKKRIISIMLVLCMFMAFVPQAAVAAESDWENKIWIGDTPVNKSTNMTDSTWVFFPLYNTLVLNDGFAKSDSSNLTGSNDKAVIRIESFENLTIQVVGNATVGTAGSENNDPNGTNIYGIYAADTNLVIEGDGTLNVYSNSNALWCKCLKVEGSTLNCNSYRTAIRVMSSTGRIDSSIGSMNVYGGAKVTARTVNGGGIYPEKYYSSSFGTYGEYYKDEGGAAILVPTFLIVENSTVTAENACNDLPDKPSSYEGNTDVFNSNRFCTSIFAWNYISVSGSNASVTGKLSNNETDFGNIESGSYSRLGAVATGSMYINNGGTIEGFITNSNYSRVTQGLRKFQPFSVQTLTRAAIEDKGEGTVRSGIANASVAIEVPEYLDCNYTDNIRYIEENFSPTEQYASHLEITIGDAKTVYLRKTDSGQEWSFDSNFLRAHSIDSTTVDLRDLSNSVFVEKGWSLDRGTPKIHVKSGDWTIIPPCETEADYCIKGGSLTIRPQDGMEYAGGRAQIEIGATLNIDGDGIAKNWDVSACLGKNRGGGTLRFVSGTVENASASIGISVCIIGGNINFKPIPMMQNVKNGDGTKLYRDVYFMWSKADELILINTGEGTITPESSYYYPIGYDKALVVWTVNDLPIKYVTVAPEDGETYNLIPGGVIESLGNEYHSLVRAERYKEFVPNPNYKFFRNPDESVTMNAAGSINTYENRLDSAFYGPYLIGSTTDLDSSLRAEWSYQNDNGEKVVVGGNSLTCKIDDLSDIVNYRTYTCTVYEKAADGSEKAIGSYNANVYVMRWEQPDTIYAAIGQEVTFTANPSEETEWAAGFLSTLKWQVNKGAGWEDIPDSQTDSYTVAITEENAGYKYRRVINGYLIGNFDKHEASIYIEFTSPELSVTLAPEITSQPQSIRIQENDTAKHELCVSANNAESYRWQKQVVGSFVDIEGETSSTLEVGVGDVGTYRCVVSNRFGETVSEEASVGKGLAPSCGILSGVKVTLGAKAQFNVGISNAPGDGSVSVKWQYSADNGATWVDVVSYDDSKNISMNVLEMVFSQIWSDGTVIRRYEISSSSMTINKTAADMDGWKVRCVLTDAVGVYYSNTVELQVEIPDYTVAFNTDGGTEIASKTPVKWDDKVLDGITVPAKEGWEFIGWKYGDVTVNADTTYGSLASSEAVTSITLTAQWKDIDAPAGEISIGENKWNSILNKITFGLFFKDTQKVTITASDNSGEAVAISYLLSDKALAEDILDESEFSTYTDGFDIEPNNEWIIYAKLTDKAGNVKYLSSDGIVLDNVAPVISGVENGKTYCGAQTVTVDEKYIDSVKVDGKEALLENNQFTLNPADGTQTIVATDKAGNVSAEITVTVNYGHTAGDDDGDCTTPVYCIYHPDTVVVAAKSHDFSGEWQSSESGHRHICQNDGCTVAETETPHSCTDDGDCTTAVICECGYIITEAKSHDFGGEWYNDGAGQYWQKCKYCDYETAKKDIPTVTINGADSVCITQDYKFSFTLPEGATDALYGYEFEYMGAFGLELIAEDGKLYGAVSAGDYDLSANSFKISVSAKTADGFDISASKVVWLRSEHTDADPKDHICDICGVKFSEHSGGEATCTDKAVCDYCGKEYGELDSSKHDLEKIPAKDTTAAETGNKEHWHCPDCDKYFADENGENEIELEDTKIAKLPPEIIDGKGQTVSAEKQEDVSFRSNADIDDFIRVELDGVTVDAENYTVTEDGTITLKADYVETLPAGEHTIGIVSESGTAAATFTVKAKPAADNDTNAPQTGDNSHMALWIGLLLVSGSVLIGTALVSKKRKYGKN